MKELPKHRARGNGFAPTISYVLGFRYFAFNKANVQLMLGLRAHPERFGSSRSCARPPFVSQISNNQFSNAGSSHWRCFRGTLVLRRGATPGKRLTHPSLGTTACKRFQAPCSNTSTTRTGRSVREQDPPRASGPAPRTRPSTARSARATRVPVRPSAPTADFARRRATPPRTRSVAILEKTRILRRPIGFNISLRVAGAGTCSRRGGTTGAEWILLCGANGILLCGATYPPGGGVAARCI